MNGHLITKLERQGKPITDKTTIHHDCPCTSAIIVRFCTECACAFDGDGLDLRAGMHEKMTGHSIREHVFCDGCHGLAARGLKIAGEYYWSMVIVRKDHIQSKVERVIYENSTRLLENQAT